MRTVPSRFRRGLRRLGRCAAVALLAGAARAAPFASALQWESTERTVPMHAEDAVARATFVCVNGGKTPVEITRIVPSCGCTVAATSRRRLAPGERAEIAVEFHRGNREGFHRLTVSIQTSESATPTLLSLDVDIESPVQIEPRFLLWPAGAARTPRSARLTLSSGGLVKILGVACGSPAYAANLVPVAGSEREFTLAITPPAEGITFSSITVRVQVGNRPTELIYSLLARTL